MDKELTVPPEQYSISRSLLEVYRTDEENFEPYVPRSSYDDKKEEERKKEEDKEEADEEEEEEETEETEDGFTLHQGEILDTYYYGDFTSINYESDYEDINDTGSINQAEIKDLNRFYKGVRGRICKSWEAPRQKTDAEKMPEVFKGFITEESFNESGMELSLSGMTKLLEKEYQFEFSQMKRSDIIKEVIKTAGLKPVVDPTGLNDEVIDYSNISKSDNGDGDDGDEGADTSGVISTDVKDLAKKVCKGKKSDRAKASAICLWIAKNIPYPQPNYENHRKCPSEVLRTRSCNCCDRARLGYEMGKVVGLTGRGVHGPYHVWVQYKIDGQWVNSDPSGSRTTLGVTWKGMSMDRLWSFPSC